MPIRIPFTNANPFNRRSTAGTPEIQDENVRPALSIPKDSYSGFERVDTVGSKASSALSIRSARSQDNGDYKMSVVNDSGVYLPPSPTEEKSLWPRRPAPPSRTSMDTRSSVGDIEHFSISRESFDSYRRSFDIQAKSPVTVHEMPRHSLDSARFPRQPRSSLRDHSFKETPTYEERFEEVGLNDEQQEEESAQPQQPKKRSLFAKFTEAQDPNPSGMSRFIPGRKRAQSNGLGSELGPMERPKSIVVGDGEEMR